MGAICNNVTYPSGIGGVDRLLSGKHLKIFMVQWKPYAMYNASKTGNDAWTGFDADLVNYIAPLANFTFDFVKLSKNKNQSWDEAAIYGSRNSDLVTSWWTHTSHRRQNMVQLYAHVDSSFMLIVDGSPKPSKPLLDVAFLFLKPFSNQLWFAILLLGPTVAFVMMAFEPIGKEHPDSDFADTQTRFGAFFKSMYYTVLAFIDYGGHSPCTPSGRAFLIIYGMGLFVIRSNSDLNPKPNPNPDPSSVTDITVLPNPNHAFNPTYP